MPGILVVVHVPVDRLTPQRLWDRNWNSACLTTPRGSGTNGYVIRNLSTLRVHQTAAERAAAWDVAPPKHREPDEAILEHERKRKVEVKCLELQLELEDQGMDDEKIETQVDELREKLLQNLASLPSSAKSLRPSDTHGIAAAKKAELSKMARALGTRSNYSEGEAFDCEKQEENRLRRLAEREERDKKREEERAKMLEQRQKWEAEKKERDRLRRREEDRLRQEREEADLKRKERMPPPPLPPSRDRPRDVRERGRYRDNARDRQSRSPLRPEDRERDRDIRRRRRSPSYSRSRSPPPRRSPSPNQIKSRSRSPYGHQSRRPGVPPPPTPPRRTRSRSESPPLRRARRHSESPPPKRIRDRSDSPPPRRTRSPYHQSRGRDMDVDKPRGRRASVSPRSDHSGRSRSRSASSSIPAATSRIRLFANRRTPINARFASGVAPEPSASKRYLSPTYSFSSTVSPETANTLALGDEYILGVYARPSLVLSHGRGCWVWDKDGRRFLDFSAGIAVNALGHSDPELVEVFQTQASKLIHTSNAFHNEWAPKLAKLLVDLTQRDGGLGYAAGSTSSSGAGAKVFFANSGTEANEGALKIARKVGKDRWAAKTGGKPDDPACIKTRIACFESSFHGRSMGALSVTSNAKYQTPFTPLIPNIDRGVLNDHSCLNGLVGEDTCAVIVECIQGEGGINGANEEWLRALRKRCDEMGAVLIFDEIQASTCGMYRTGTMWAHSVFPVDCHPDMLTVAKPLANGYPIGAVLMRDSIALTMTPGTHGTTFGGSPMACALGHHVLSRISSRPFITNLQETSAYLSDRLELLPKWFPEFLHPEVRGRGLIRGLGFKNLEHPGEVVRLARERGVFMLTAGKDAVRLVPSLNVEKEQVDMAVDVLEGCLSTLRG
ncbi:hypothetical protein SERLA73DRAFT_70836 [Serpula lacrymans var. lacrymans S7.3]|uniref:CWF21 domain-containing protein n=1 Tax=Serpula lacrymans var. lacrymans (strain S7.3) TaxID=936435 RepID=F8PR11_SERL3|nr:hypothetical protein SERLA73DRAFT_70836 [Serpula lacrymans var. lacrymans S7.3]